MKSTEIVSIQAREILDSRGDPTVEAKIVLADGSEGRASVPSGASTGIFEAIELRDGDAARFGGRGVLKALRAVTQTLAPSLMGVDAAIPGEADRLIIALDGTNNKANIGSNAALAVSLAAAKAVSRHYGLPLYQMLGGMAATRLPIPMLNILNGGAHASNNIEIQEFMIVPHGFSDIGTALRSAVEIYHTLGGIIRSRGLSTAVGDEGGFAPDLASDEAALELICEAIHSAGYDTSRVSIALDAASGEWYNNERGLYCMPKRGLTLDRTELCEHFETLVRRFPICSLEDPLDQRDFDGWAQLTARIGRDVMLVGDDLFVTNTERLSEGIKKGAANAVLVKPNQIGTLWETLSLIRTAREHGYSYILSHRSGETEDTAIADIAVATGAPFIKTGAPCRGERTAKYNRLLEIAEELGAAALYGGQYCHPCSDVYCAGADVCGADVSSDGSCASCTL